MARKRSERSVRANFLDSIGYKTEVDEMEQNTGENNKSELTVHEDKVHDEHHKVEEGHESIINAENFLRGQIVLKSHHSEPVEKSIPAGNGVPLPSSLRPNFRFLWGDGPKDKIETDDVENVLLEVVNPYTNVVIKDLTVFSVEIIVDGKPPAELPDGTPSVTVTPSKMIRFGDLASHSESVVPSLQELVLISRGAKPGTYEIRLHFHFSVELTQFGKQGFNLELVRS
ncbi:MAG: hypothetical protein ACI9UT_001023 [Flavobacteriales bacterium]|jgi:hypothetical protein